jgi:hypothetical protein
MKTGKYKVQLSQAGEQTVNGEFVVLPKYPFWMKAASLASVVVIVVEKAIENARREKEFPPPPDLTN